MAPAEQKSVTNTGFLCGSSLAPFFFQRRLTSGKLQGDEVAAL